MRMRRGPTPAGGGAAVTWLLLLSRCIRPAGAFGRSECFAGTARGRWLEPSSPYEWQLQNASCRPLRQYIVANRSACRSRVGRTESETADATGRADRTTADQTLGRVASRLGLTGTTQRVRDTRQMGFMSMYI